MRFLIRFCSLIFLFLQFGLAQRAESTPIPLELFQESEPRDLRSWLRVEDRPEVVRWIHYFTTRNRDRDRFDRFMWRGALYQNLIQDILVNNGVPADFYYLAMIESGFARSAKSRANAVGIWQFGKDTGRLYGLRIDRDVDERLDILRATEAAARHLKSLKAEFGNWHLAMAAYNCGVGCVRRAVRRGGTRDFWRLAKRGLLPTETVNYIPKFEAAMKISKHPEIYGFEAKTCYEFPDVKRIRIMGRTDLTEVAKRNRVSAKAVLALNPHLLNGRTPSSRGGYEVWLPQL